MPKLPYRFLTVVVSLLFVVMFFFDILDLLLEVGHLLLEVLELLFEVFEFLLDEIVEHLFHTDKSTSQIIVFYIILLLFSLFAFWFKRKLPRMFRKLRTGWCEFWGKTGDDFLDFWQPLTLLNKTLWVSGTLTFLYLLSFLLF
ncbi:MAG: hypothetical protein RQ715_01860 [Methylococcales bacterium]|nr:hypothetical protein [Methylococcales bacterium]